MRECEVDLYKASGAGGQKRNKTSSAVRMRHTATGTSVSATRSRSQAKNRRIALAKLRTSIALDLREPVHELNSVDLATTISKGPRGKNSKSRTTASYLEQLAIVLDVLEASSASLSVAAMRIGVTTASLVKLLRGDDRLVRRVSHMRVRYGLKPLQ
ncbi:MAG: hypothetical protein GY811_09410 [Myxococcales bacterium]|nr:hypothetical protein [Myxococcales bacterium]